MKLRSHIRWCRVLVRSSVIGLLAAASAAVAAQPDSPLKVINIPAEDGSGAIVKLESHGKAPIRYTAFETADNTTFDLTGVQFSPGFEHPTQTTFTAGNQDVPPKSIRIVGGVVDGCLPHEWNWRLAHGFGGAGIYTVASGLQVLERARIHNVEDGWQPRETPGFSLRAYANTGRFLIRDCYMTGIRDDCIENDEFLPGDVEDCLFDGVWTFFSEQHERPNGVLHPSDPTIGPNEDPEIHITRALVRLYITSQGETRHGMWFKLMGKGAPLHKYVITDSVFAAYCRPEASNFIRKDATFKFRGTNYILWLGERGGYTPTVPAGVIFLEGQPAKDKWHQVRNEWLVRHGYEPRPADAWSPMEAPVEPPRAK